MAKKNKTHSAAQPKKKSIFKIMAIIFGILMILAIVGTILPEPDSSYVKVNMEDYPEWIDFVVDRDAPASDSEALIDAANLVAKYNVSEKVLWQQMEENYSNEDTAYVKNHLNITWNQVCSAAASNYAKEMSRAKVLTKLQKDQFTDEQIDYANQKLNTFNFNETAAKKASELKKKENLSPDAISQKLSEDQKFTETEVAYALKQLTD